VNGPIAANAGRKPHTGIRIILAALIGASIFANDTPPIMKKPKMNANGALSTEEVEDRLALCRERKDNTMTPMARRGRRVPDHAEHQRRTPQIGDWIVSEGTQSAEDYLRESITGLLDEIGYLDPVECGAHGLDVDGLRETLRPLIAAPTIATADLECVRDQLADMKGRIEDWQSYRNDIGDTVADIIQAAAPGPEAQEAARQSWHAARLRAQAKAGLAHAEALEAETEELLAKASGERCRALRSFSGPNSMIPLNHNQTFQHNDGGRAQAGYKGKASDCVCRAIAIVTELPYQTVYDSLNAFGMQERRSKGKSSAHDGVYPATCRRYLESLGFRWVSAPGAGCRVHLRAEELPPGRLLVSCSRHLTAVIDGVVHDIYDPSRGGTRCVYGYFQLPQGKD
jgi:hypothetical protein